jgi:tetratricopeptide (TPR) repeat protein
MKKDINFEKKQEGWSPGESANADPNEQPIIPPFSFLESYDQGLNKPAYQNDPHYRELLLSFQNAQWDACLEKIDQLLIIHPKDTYLLAFKQDVEVRLKLQGVVQQYQSEENRKERRRISTRVFLLTALGLSVVIFIGLTAYAYQKKQTQARLAQEAALLEQSLAEKYQTAESFMRVDKPEEALRLYGEIQQISPSYKDIDEKIEQTKQSMAMEEIYQQGIQAIQAGKSAEALEFLLKVEELHPKYKDTLKLLEKIEQEQKIAALVEEIQELYLIEDWTGVIRAHEAIRSIDPFYKITDLKDILFVSYRNVIVDIAGRGDVTVEEIELAEKYYRIALSIFPQNKEYVGERQELQKVAVELLANKYYLHAITMLQSSNYSAEGLQELIRILTKAGNIGTSSPAIKVEIEKSQLFLNSYDNLLQRKWDNAISGFEIVRRKDENFANGRLKYLLYESYTARGDLLFAYADFKGASVDYQEAEKFVWSSEENMLRLFQIQTRTAAALHKLGQVEESVEFYHYAFERLGYKKKLTGTKGRDLLNTINQAELAYKNSDNWEAIRLYEIAVGQVDVLYDHVTVAVEQGDTLADIAFKYGSTIESLRAANDLGEIMIIGKDQEILVPFISNASQ